MRRLLRPAELLLRGINRTRRALYRAGILRSRRLPVPVISVGGISAGGSGKTPAVIAIAEALVRRGLRVGVLTRGYGRSGAGGVVEALDADRYGDEPVLIKKHVPEATVIVAVKRYENALQQSVDVFILDDGFQHLRIARDCDVVIDHRGGLLREGPSALRYADVVLQRQVRPVVPAALRGMRLFAFAGLADDAQFFRSLGVPLAGQRSFPDHHRYTPADIAEIKRSARDAGAGAIVTTEKDAVKIDDPEIVAIPAEMVIEPETMERILAAVRR